MAQILELKLTTDQARIFSINFERRVLAQAVSKRTKKSSEVKFTPFLCKNRMNH